MIVPDVNILIHGYDTTFPQHEPAKGVVARHFETRPSGGITLGDECRIHPPRYESQRLRPTDDCT